VKRQSLIFLAGGFLLIFLAFFLTRIPWNADLHHRFLPDDPALQGLIEEQELFGSAETLFLLADSDRPVPLTDLGSLIAGWREELLKIQGIEKVTSLLDLPSIRWEGPTAWKIVPVSEQEDPSRAAERHPLAKDFLKKDGKGFLVVLTLTQGTMQHNREGREVVERLSEWAGEKKSPFRITVAGPLVFQTLAMDEAYRDAGRITLLLLFVFVILLSLVFRTFLGVLAVLGIGVLSVSATFGLAGLLGWSVSPFSLFAVPVIVAVSLLDNIHLFFGYRLARAEGSSEKALQKVLHELFFPVLWTALTTIAGFSSLLALSVPQIRQFGALSALGIAVDFVATFALLPRLLTWLDPQPALLLPQRLEKWFAPQPHKRGRVVITVSAILLLVSLPGIFRIRIVADFPRLFSDSHPITAAMKRIEKEWGGMTTVSYLLRLKEGVEPQDPRIPSRLRDFTVLLASRELVTGVSSPFDFVIAAERSFRERFGKSPSPEERNILLDQLTREASNDAIPLRVTARIKMMEPEKFPDLARDLYGFEKNLSDLFEVRLTGWPLLFKNMEERLLTEMFKGFALAFAAVDLLLLLPAIRSLRWWVLSLLPNLLPLVAVFGGMGLLGHGFSSGLLLVPAVAMGLLVDDTIHFVSRIRLEMKRTDSVEKAIRAALRHSGTAITLTSLLLAAGFATLSVSSFRANRELAFTMVGVIVCGLAAELWLLPALLLSLKPSPPSRYPSSQRPPGGK
jgi:predicted RND superfamily exporter protein